MRLTDNAQFRDSLPTEVLLAKFDKLFDILNAQFKFGKKYQKAIAQEKLVTILDFLQDMNKFLLALEDYYGKRMVHTKRHTFVVGLGNITDSICHLASLLLAGDGINSEKLFYLLTYKTSQNNIKTMFTFMHR